MPFKSLAQKQKFKEMLASGKISQETHDKMEKGSAEHHKLPERVSNKPKSIRVQIIK